MTFVLAHPLRLAGAHFAVVDSDGEGGLAQEIAVLASTRQGERPLIPEYGISDPVGVGVDPAELNRGLALFGPDNLLVTGVQISTVDRATQAVLISFDSAPPPPSPDDVFYQ